MMKIKIDVMDHRNGESNVINSSEKKHLSFKQENTKGYKP